MNSRLKTYALSASGTATLVAGGVTNADIIPSDGPVNIQPTNSPTGPIPSTLFEVAGQEVQAANFMAGSWSGSGLASVRINVDGDGLRIGTVTSGSTISAGATFALTSVYNTMFFAGNTMTTQNTSGMPIGTSVLLGFSISDTADTFYGWINYSLSMSEGEYTLTINSWAYNDVAGEGIIAGQNQAAGSSAVPGLGGLAALAIGAAGVRS